MDINQIKQVLTLKSEFEYFDDLELGLGINSFYEKIETSSSASAQQKTKKEIILIII